MVHFVFQDQFRAYNLLAPIYFHYNIRHVSVTCTCDLLTFELFPIPNLGRPLFKPSKSKQALQISILETYPHLVQLPWAGSFSLMLDLKTKFSPE